MSANGVRLGLEFLAEDARRQRAPDVVFTRAEAINLRDILLSLFPVEIEAKLTVGRDVLHVATKGR